MFWTSTPHEMFAAIEVGLEMAGKGEPADDAPTDWEQWHAREFGG